MPTQHFPTTTNDKTYMYRHVATKRFNLETPESESVTNDARNLTLDTRYQAHHAKQMVKQEQDAILNANRLRLKKKEAAEERLMIRTRDNQLNNMWNDPMSVVHSLRERCRHKPHLLINMFPPKDTGSMGFILLDDFARGLSMMGFNLTIQKLQMVLTILGISALLRPGHTIPLSQLKTVILDKNLEDHHNSSVWKAKGGGKLASAYTQRSSNNSGDPAFERLKAAESQNLLEAQNRNKPVEFIMSENLRAMLHKLADRFSSVRRAFRTMDKDKSGSLTRLELKNILDTFCMVVDGKDFDELMAHFDADGDGLISYEEFLHCVKNEISPQLQNALSMDPNNKPSDSNDPTTPTKPPSHDFNSNRRPQRQYTTTYSASYVKPGFLPVKTLDELKIYQDFLQKISKEMGSVQEAFMAIDIHREGYITKDELKAVLDNFAFKMNKDQFDAMVNLLDRNHDGKISYDEFLDQVKYCDDDHHDDDHAAKMATMMAYDETPEAKRKLQQMKNKARKVTSYEFLMEKIWEKHSTMHEAFKKMDTDGSGSLSANELKNVLDSYCYKVPDAVFAEMLGMFDADGDGEISFHEFMAQRNQEESDVDGSKRKAENKKANQLRKKVAKSSTALKNICMKIYDSSSSMRTVFRSMDKDGSGSLDPEELRNVFLIAGFNVTDTVFAEVLETFDEDGDGEINFQEFLAKLKEICDPPEEGGVGMALANKASTKSKGRVHGGAVDKSANLRQGNTVGAALRFICEKIHEKWENIRKSFMMLDWDKSGTISPEEFRAVLDDCCYTVSDDVFSQLVEIFDQDGDGEISYNELLEQMKKVVSGDMSDVDKIKKRRQELEAGINPDIKNRREGTEKRYPGMRSEFGETNDDGLNTTIMGKYSRFDDKLDDIPNLGHGHLHICKAIEAKYAVIKDSLERMDYNKQGFLASRELLASVETYCGRCNPILWDDIMLFFDSSRTGLVDYKSFLNDVRDQVLNKYSEDNNSNVSLRKAFNKAGGGVVSHHNMQDGKRKGGGIGMGSHGSNSVEASMRFLCEKVYEKFPTIRSAFMSMDKDRGGTIGKRELKKILDDCCYIVPDDVFEACYKLFDTDGDGEISYQEFIEQVKVMVAPGEEEGGLGNMLINHDKRQGNKGNKGVKELYEDRKGSIAGPSHNASEAMVFLGQKLAQQTDSVRVAFRMFDSDLSGSVSKAELKRILDNYCYKMSDEEFDKVVLEIDVNTDGKISYNEFMNSLGQSIIPSAPHAKNGMSGVGVGGGAEGNGNRKIKETTNTERRFVTDAKSIAAKQKQSSIVLRLVLLMSGVKYC